MCCHNSGSSSVPLWLPLLWGGCFSTALAVTWALPLILPCPFRPRVAKVCYSCQFMHTSLWMTPQLKSYFKIPVEHAVCSLPVWASFMSMQPVQWYWAPRSRKVHTWFTPLLYSILEFVILLNERLCIFFFSLGPINYMLILLLELWLIQGYSW